MRMALTKLEANMELGQSYAGLYALNEGLHVLNYLRDEDYQFFKKRYSDKLVHAEEESQVDQTAAGNPRRSTFRRGRAPALLSAGWPVRLRALGRRSAPVR